MKKGDINQEPNYQEETKAGLRIKEITDYDQAGQESFKRRYTYKNGMVISEPRYYYISNELFYYTGPATDLPDNQPINLITNAQMLHRLSSASGTDKPHIGYEEVTETILSNNQEENGRVVHTFYTDEFPFYKDGIYSGLSFGTNSPNNYFVDYELGKPMVVETYDQEGTLVNQARNEYYQKEFYTNNSIYARNNPSLTKHYPAVSQSPSDGLWYITPTPLSLLTRYAGVELELEYYTELPDIGIPAQYLDPLYVMTTILTTETIGSAGNIRVAEATQFFDQSDSIKELIIHDYYDEIIPPSDLGGLWINPDDNSVIVQKGTVKDDTPIKDDPGNTTIETLSYLPKQTIRADSKGDINVRKYLYPDNYVGAYDDLISENIISAPIHTITIKNSDTLFSQRMYYEGTLPSHIKVAKAKDELETRLFFERYENDNLVQLRPVNGASISYIWGYDARYVIAKIENATYEDIEDLSEFGANFTISLGLSPSQEAALRSLPGALVTTFNYDPVVGVTSQTDPKGYTIYYDYDDFNRLKQVRDRNGKILSTTGYNYGTSN